MQWQFRKGNARDETRPYCTSTWMTLTAACTGSRNRRFSCTFCGCLYDYYTTNIRFISMGFIIIIPMSYPMQNRDRRHTRFSSGHICLCRYYPKNMPWSGNAPFPLSEYFYHSRRIRVWIVIYRYVIKIFVRLDWPVWLGARSQEYANTQAGAICLGVCARGIYGKVMGSNLISKDGTGGYPACTVFRRTKIIRSLGLSCQQFT